MKDPVTTAAKRAYAAVLDRMLRRYGYGDGLRGIVRRERYDALARELYECLHGMRFPDLPPCDGRFELLLDLQGTDLAEAMYILDALHKSLALLGDICELGVAQGATSALLANEIRHTDKRLWLFDTFRGLPAPTAEDVLLHDIFALGSMHAYTGTMANPRQLVEHRLRSVRFPPERTRLIEGMVEDTLSRTQLPRAVCFAYLDLDFFAGTRAALAFLADAVPAGGHLVVDDYEHFSAGPKAAVEDLLRARPGCFDLIVPDVYARKFVILRRTAAA